MFYVLQYPGFTSLSLSTTMCDVDGLISNNQVFNWLVYGKLPETITVDPGYTRKTRVANAKNRYISDVVVNAIKPTTSTVTLAVGAALVITDSLISSAISSDPAFATAVVADGVLTITGVAAGTTTVTVKDASGALIETITVTVA